jgi:hypothetical protein
MSTAVLFDPFGSPPELHKLNRTQYEVGSLGARENRTAVDIGKTLCVFTPAVGIEDTDSASDRRYRQRE